MAGFLGSVRSAERGKRFGGATVRPAERGKRVGGASVRLASRGKRVGGSVMSPGFRASLMLEQLEGFETLGFMNHAGDTRNFSDSLLRLYGFFPLQIFEEGIK